MFRNSFNVLTLEATPQLNPKRFHPNLFGKCENVEITQAERFLWKSESVGREREARENVIKRYHTMEIRRTVEQLAKHKNVEKQKS